MPDKYSFEKRFSSVEKFVFKYDRGIMKDILKHKVSGKVLDLGCGTGGLSLDLAMKGYDVTCVDISSTAIERIREEAELRGVKINAVVADLEEYEIEGKYDVIIVCGVLQFLHEWGESFLEGVKGHTFKGGINVIDAFRNKWLPEGRLEKIYSDWDILEIDEYVWKKDDFAKMIYLVVQNGS